jgi:hypothetical protein
LSHLQTDKGKMRLKSVIVLGGDKPSQQTFVHSTPEHSTQISMKAHRIIFLRRMVRYLDRFQNVAKDIRRVVILLEPDV